MANFGAVSISGNTEKTNAYTSLQDYLKTRRSTPAKSLTAPGPNEQELQQILTIAARVPDHKKLVPWRFIVLQGQARAAFGKRLADIWREREPEASQIKLDIERERFLRAPTIIAVISSPKQHPACPEWEQILSAGAVCMNLLHAAAAFSYNAQWITEWYSFDRQVAAAFGLEASERFAGFIYIGKASDHPGERDRPDLAQIMHFPDGPAG